MVYSPQGHRAGHDWVTKQLQQQQAWFWLTSLGMEPLLQTLGRATRSSEFSHATPKVDLPFHTVELTGRVSPTSWPHLLGAYSHRQRTGGKMGNAEILFFLEGKPLGNWGKRRPVFLAEGDWRGMSITQFWTYHVFLPFPKYWCPPEVYGSYTLGDVRVYVSGV